MGLTLTTPSFIEKAFWVLVLLMLVAVDM